MEGGRLPGNAGEFETSTMLVLDPDRVHSNDIDNESAALGSREKGEKLIELAAGVTSILEKMIAGQEIDLPPATARKEGFTPASPLDAMYQTYGHQREAMEVV